MRREAEQAEWAERVRRAIDALEAQAERAVGGRCVPTERAPQDAGQWHQI